MWAMGLVVLVVGALVEVVWFEVVVVAIVGVVVGVVR